MAAIRITRALLDGTPDGAPLATLHLDPELRVFHIRFTRTTRLTIATTSLVAAICKEPGDLTLTALALLPAAAPAHPPMDGNSDRNTMTETAEATHS